MNKQKTALGTTGLKVLLLAIGLAGLVQPSLANDDFDDAVPAEALLAKIQAPSSYLGGISLERFRRWQPAAAYRIGMALDGYGPAIADREADPSTAQGDIGIDPVQT